MEYETPFALNLIFSHLGQKITTAPQIQGNNECTWCTGSFSSCQWGRAGALLVHLSSPFHLVFNLHFQLSDFGDTKIFDKLGICTTEDTKDDSKSKDSS